MRRTALTLLLLLAMTRPAVAQPTGLPVDSLAVGDPAPAFVMKKVNTTDYVFLSDYAGMLRESALRDDRSPQVVVLSFFATWCKPCAEEMPQLLAVAREFADRGVVAFLVNVSEQDSPVAAWLEQHPEISGTVLMDPFATFAIKYGVDSLPRTIIIDRAGVIRFIERGFQTEGYQTNVRAALSAVLGG